MTFPLFLVFLAVSLTGISQVLLKIGSTHHGKRKDSIFAAYLNMPTIFAYGLLLLVTLINVIILKQISLKLLYAIASLNVVVVVILSWLLLRERVTKKMIGACLFIVLGIIIFNAPW
jgi:drug/metabolite transporter (DMT)-like permease